MPGEPGRPAPADWAVCAECGTRYDARPLAFCPRCGATARAPGSGPAAAGRGPRPRDPARMRVQLGGLLMLLVGGFFLLGAGAFVLDPGASEGRLYDLYASGPPAAAAGEIVVLVSDGGAPAEAQVAVRANGTLVASGPTSGGRFNASTQGHMAVEVNVTHEGRSWVRRALAPSLATTEVRIDVAADPQASGRVAGAGTLVAPTMAAFLVVSLLLSLGGLAAVLVRWRGVALAGALPMLALAVLLVLTFFGAGAAAMLASLAVLALVGGPYALVVSGRSAFRRR